MAEHGYSDYSRREVRIIFAVVGIALAGGLIYEIIRFIAWCRIAFGSLS